MKFEDYTNNPISKKTEPKAHKVYQSVQTKPTRVLEREKPNFYQTMGQNENLAILQRNLGNCLSIIDDEVMKGYITKLSDLPIVTPNNEVLKHLNPIYFFKISEMVYQEDEFFMPKLETVFHSLSNKKCTLVLMVKSDGKSNHLYLGVRPTKFNHSTQTMFQVLKSTFSGMFPGSKLEDVVDEKEKREIQTFDERCISSMTCVADYKQEKQKLTNKDFIQGLEKFIDSMQGKAYTAIFIANNLEHSELMEIRHEYEEIGTQISPFVNLQFQVSTNTGKSVSDGESRGSTNTISYGQTEGKNWNISNGEGESVGTSTSSTTSNTRGESTGISTGETDTKGDSDSISESTSVSVSIAKNTNAGINIPFVSASKGISTGVNIGRSKGTSHSESTSHSVNKTLSHGLNHSLTDSTGYGESKNKSTTKTYGIGSQMSENYSVGNSFNLVDSKTLTDSFGQSEGIILNATNMTLNTTLERLKTQLDRMNECESFGMWRFSAYFLGEGRYITETAANIYQSVVSGVKSGVEKTAINTWDNNGEIATYLKHFLHPVFEYKGFTYDGERTVFVDPTSLVSTSELALHMCLPQHSIQGVPVIKHAVFGQEVRNNIRSNSKELKIGKIFHMGQTTDMEVNLDCASLTMHTFVTGSTGMGKSNAVYTILDRLRSRHNIPFLVIEPAKGEYKHVFGQYTNVEVYGTNPKCSKLLQINPFKFPEGIHVLEHIDRLIEIFNVCWPMYAAMPAILKDAILGAYEKCGWDLVNSENRYHNQLFPTFLDLEEELVQVIEHSAYAQEMKSNYMGSLLTRVKSLTNGLYGQIFGVKEIDNTQLFDKNTIVDLSRVKSSETKSFIMGILVMRLSEHREAYTDGMNLPLRHITVLEEAHNILKRTSTEQSMEGANIAGKSVEMISNAIAEMRTYGEAFLIADQSPNAVDISAIRNTNTKIIMRLPDEMDRRSAGKAAGLNEEQIEEVAKLPRGVAVVYQSEWIEPILCKVDRFSGKEELFYYGESSKIEIDKKQFFTELLKFLLCARVKSKALPNISYIDEQLPNISLSTKQKIELTQLLKEYQVFHKIHLWEDGRFSELSQFVVELFSHNFSVDHLIKTVSSYTELNRKLMEYIEEQTVNLPELLKFNICQCFMKEYSKQNEYTLKIYSKWKQEMIERGKVL